jgi:hypothetical protein
MAYQQDPNQPRPMRDPLAPLPDEPVADRRIEGMNDTRDSSPMAGILGGVAVIVLIVIGVLLFRDPTPTDPARTAAQERTMTPPATTAPSTNAVPK